MTRRTTYVNCALTAALAMTALNVTTSWAGVADSSLAKPTANSAFSPSLHRPTTDDGVVAPNGYTGPAWVDPTIGDDAGTIEAFNMIVSEIDEPINMTSLSDLENHRGRRVNPARIPYFSDFEYTVVGPEWTIDGMKRKDGLSQFGGPFGEEPQFLDIETLADAAYLLTFDIYLLTPGHGAMFAVEIDGEVMYEESMRSLGDRAAEPLDVDTPVIEGLMVGFSATGPVTEITFVADGAGGQQWGIDNVRIEVLPSANLSQQAESESAGGGAAGRQPRATPGTRNRGARVRNSRGGRPSSSGGIAPPTIDDLFEEPVDDFEEPIVSTPDPEPTIDPDPTTPPFTPTPTPGPDDETTSTTPDRPTPPGDDGPETPAPGGAALLLLGASGALRRRR